MKKNVSANVVKDVTVKQVILNITDTDKINIVSSQAVLKMSSFSTGIRSVSSSPLINSLVKNRLFKSALDIEEPQFQFIHSMDLSLIDTTLHDSPRWRIRIYARYNAEICGDEAIFLSRLVCLSSSTFKQRVPKCIV